MAHTITKGASPQTFTVNSKVNDAKQCGTFTATLSYKSSGSSDDGKKCAEVTRYYCSTKGKTKDDKPLQDFVGCTAGLGTSTPGSGTSTPGSGSTNQTINLTDPNGGGNTIHLKCDKKQCPYTDDQIKIIADGAGLCDKDGNTLVSVEQAALYTQDVEDCIIDNNKFLVKSSDSEVCKTYCVEDYSFKSDGLMLSAQDKDENGRVIITAGS